MQIILCLVSNAIKFTKKGKVEIGVSIFEKEHEKYVKVVVTDTEIGIHQNDLCKLFKLFGFLEDKQLVNRNGVGLGLMIAK